MILKRSLFLLLATIMLQACAPTGPVKFYEGENRSADQIARVMVPGPLTVKSIDGRPVQSPSQESGFYELHLAPGKHLIAFKYELYWGSEVSGMLVKSKLVAVDRNFEAGKVYELTYPRPENEDEAFEISQQFSANLVDRQSGEKTASYAIDDPNTAVLALSLSSQSSAPASSSDSAVQPGTRRSTKDPGTLPDAEQAVNEDAVKRLKFWWLMASEAEREAFRKWMRQDMPKFGGTE